MTMKRAGMILAASLVLCLVLMGCAEESSFTGNKAGNEDGFWMDYTVLNRQEEAFLHLAAGDMLQVELAHEKGTVDVTVGMDGKDAIYEGNGLAKLRFILNITEDGDYRISVTGHKARGSVTFEVIPYGQQDSTAGDADDKAGTEEAGSVGTAEVSATVDASKQSDATADPKQAERYAAYQFALQQIAFEHVYPDGTDTGFDGASGFIEENHFALYDVNGDGRDELIVQFVTAPMAGNVESVYSYQEDGSLIRQLAVFPSMKYYDNGMVREDWSHGSALAGDNYWPYNLYRYSEEEGEYVLLAEVNMWSKSVDTVDDKGDSYPEDIDAEKAGTVFILTRDGVTETLSKSEYEAWLSELLGDAVAIQMPYQPLTEENIKAVAFT